jgi:phosphonate transport system permease protein
MTTSRASAAPGHDATSARSVLSVRNVTVEYRVRGRLVVALKDLSLDVPAGETIAIIGRSGSGKTTLLRVLAGLHCPTAGRVEVCGRRLPADREPPRELYRDVGILFQDHGVVGELTPLENVLCGRLFDYATTGGLVRFRGEDRRRGVELLRDLGLGDRLGLRTGRLSGGEQQRVGIARLLLQEPALMLLDEPLASLDVHWAEHALGRMRAARSGSATVVAVLHDLGLARRWADRAFVIEDGALVFSGDPDEACRRLERGGVDLDPTPVSVELPAPPAFGSDLELVRERSGPPGPTADVPALGRAPFYLLVLGALAVAYVWAAWGVGFGAARIFGNLGSAGDFLQRMFPPDPSVMPTIAASLVETVQIALLGTTLAAALALPMAMMAARNVSPRALRWPARLALNALRTVPSLIWGLFFVAMVGLGPLPGVLALTFYAAGYLGKFYYEGIEAIDPRPRIALRAVGASALQRFRYGVFPQVTPLLLGFTLYMFEYNVRAASILGVVGAGGVGYYLYSYVNSFQYDRAATALLLLLLVVTAIDAASSRLRRRLQD